MFDPERKHFDLLGKVGRHFAGGHIDLALAGGR
jgi:hypothetical protein